MFPINVFLKLFPAEAGEEFEMKETFERILDGIERGGRMIGGTIAVIAAAALAAFLVGAIVTVIKNPQYLEGAGIYKMMGLVITIVVLFFAAVLLAKQELIASRAVDAYKAFGRILLFVALAAVVGLGAGILGLLDLAVLLGYDRFGVLQRFEFQKWLALAIGLTFAFTGLVTLFGWSLAQIIGHDRRMAQKTWQQNISTKLDELTELIKQPEKTEILQAFPAFIQPETLPNGPKGTKSHPILSVEQRLDDQAKQIEELLKKSREPMSLEQFLNLQSRVLAIETGHMLEMKSRMAAAETQLSFLQKQIKSMQDLLDAYQQKLAGLPSAEAWDDFKQEVLKHRKQIAQIQQALVAHNEGGHEDKSADVVHLYVSTTVNIF